MVQINIVTTVEEQIQVLKALETLVGKTIAVKAIAKEAGMNPNRVRYVISDLEEANKIRRVPTKAFNEHYIRYKYEII